MAKALDRHAPPDAEKIREYLHNLRWSSSEYVPALEQIIVDLLDGQGASDIRDMTGLPQERCDEIMRIGQILLDNVK